MINNIPKNLRWWQNKAKIAQQLQNLMADYQMRKSKFIKYTPTEQELRGAMRLYRFILELVDENDTNALKMMEIINSVSTIPETRIKFTGFMEELLKKYPTGVMPDQHLMDTAEKWDVLDYIMEDKLRALGIKLKK